MSQLRRRAAEAKHLLGSSGEIARVGAVATVYKGDVDPEDWVVEAIDSSGDGGIYVTVFSGPLARERAVEYAREKYSGLRLREVGDAPRS